jgi:MFS family permease
MVANCYNERGTSGHMGAATGRDLAVLYAAMVASRIGFGVIIIIFPAYIFRSTDIAVAGALALYPAFEAIAALPAGRLCDSRGRKVVLLGSLAYMAVLMAAVGLTRNIYIVAGFHALMGAGAAGVTVASLTMITDLTGKGNRGAGMGTFDFANVGGYALGLLVGGRLETSFGSDLSYAFYVTAGLVGVAFAIGYLVLEEPPHELAAGSMGLNPFRALDAQARAILPLWLSLTTLIGVVFFLPRAFSVLGLGTGTTALILFGGVTVLGIGSISFGALSDRIGRTRVMLIGVVGLSGLLLTAGLSFAHGPGGVVRNFPLIAIFALATSALVPSILATAGDRADATMRGSAMALYSIMLSAGVAAGTLVAGVAHNFGGLGAIVEVGALIFASACVASLLLWRRARPTKGF